MDKHSASFKVLVSAILVMLLSSCSGEKAPQTADEHFNKAHEFQQQGQLQAYVIELKNTIQRDPAHRAARRELATVYLYLGNGEDAEKEFSRALAAGDSSRETILGLARARLMMGRADEALDTVNSHIPAEQKNHSAVTALVAEALIRKQDLDGAEAALAAVDSAAGLVPEYYLVIARLQLLAGHRETARKEILKALALDPRHGESLVMLGMIHFEENDYAEANASFGKVVAAGNEKFPLRLEVAARMRLVQGLLATGDYEAAAGHVDILKKVASDSPVTSFYSAFLAYAGEDYKTARDLAAGILNTHPRYLAAQFLLGASNYAMGNYEQASGQLGKYLFEVPANIQAQRLYAATRLKLGDTSQVMASADADSKVKPDSHLMVMAATAAIKEGDFIRASRYAENARRGDSEDPAVAQQLSRLYADINGVQASIRYLQEIAASSDNSHAYDNVLKMAADNRLADALDMMTDLEKEHTPDQVYYTLNGAMQLLLKNLEAAAASLQKAVQLDNSFTPAHLYLARLHMEKGDMGKARSQYEQILQQDKKSAIAMLGLAQIQHSSGDVDAAVETLKSLIALDRSKLTPVLLLGQIYVKAGRLAEAEALLVPEAKKPSAQNQLLALYGRVQVAQGSHEAAQKTFARIIKNSPREAWAYAALAEIQLQLKDYQQAATTLERALQLEPDNARVMVRLAALMVRTGKLARAHELADKLVSKYPQRSLGYGLKGDVIFAATRDPQQALPSYRTAYEKNQSRVTTSRLARALAMAGRHEETVSLLSTWLENNRDTANLRITMANSLVLLGRKDEAEAAYKRVLVSSPDNVLALNNLSNIVADRALALDYAKKAYALRPDSADIVDTLAWLKVQAGQAREGRELFESIGLEQASEVIRYHYAMSLAATGDNDRAREMLTALIAGTGDGKLKKEMEGAMASL